MLESRPKDALVKLVKTVETLETVETVEKDKVKRSNGLQLEVGARKTPILLVFYILNQNIQISFDMIIVALKPTLSKQRALESSGRRPRRP